MSDRPGLWGLPGVRHVIPAGATALAAVGLIGGATPAFMLAGAAGPARTGSGATAGDSRYVSPAVPVTRSLATARQVVAPLRRLHQPDVIVAAKSSLPGRVLLRIRGLSAVTAAVPLDAARIQVNHTLVAMIGVDPSSFRSFAARPTASSNRLWQNIADGGIAVSYDMGKQDHLPLGGMVHVTGRSVADLPVAGFATVGIGGIDAVVSRSTAASLGLPRANAVLISAPQADMTTLLQQIKQVVPERAVVRPLVSTVTVGGATASGGSGVAGGATLGASLRSTEVTSVVNAAMSRRGMPYVWGADGPASFDCSGLVQWSFAQAGIVMPRVAADQARTGPLISISQARPGDLLFWRTDPTAPYYISHVAIYLGNGQMIQAPETGEDVEVLPVDFGAGFAGVVQVHPMTAASIAG